MNNEDEDFTANDDYWKIDRAPLISIITVCYNAEKDIEKTLHSVLNQTDIDYEYIIIDGKSTDNTMCKIQRYLSDFSEKKIDIKLISECDAGIFDAMNKGIKLARGTWINFMNAGDFFSDTSILERMKEYLIKSKADIVYGSCYRYHPFYSYVKVPGNLDLLKKGMEIPHQASFIRGAVQKKHLFSLRYRLAGDHDLFLRLYLQGYSFEYVPVLVCIFSLEGVSNTRLLEAYKETYLVLTKNKVADLKSMNSKLKYVRGYVGCLCEMMLPTNLKWKLKAMKKELADKTKTNRRY